MKINVCDANARLALGATNIARIAGLLVLSASAVFAGVGITGAPARVVWDVGDYAVAGTNTSEIIGYMWVSNATVGGAAISFSRNGLAFVAPAIALQVGKKVKECDAFPCAGSTAEPTTTTTPTRRKRRIFSQRFCDQKPSPKETGRDRK